MKKWECTVCGYIHEGEEPPDECPLCGADSSLFEEVIEQEQTAAPQEEVTKDKPAQPEEQPESNALLKTATDLILKFHLHPISVHTPNGVIPMAFLFLICTVFFGWVSFERAVFYSLVFVLINMPLVLLTGYITWQQKYKGALTSMFKLKIGASIVATALLLFLVIWHIVQPAVLTSASSGRFFYTLLALAVLAGAGIAGHLGGKLVFGVSGNK